MDALLVRDLRLRKTVIFESGGPVPSKIRNTLETHRICKKVDLPGIPPDGLVLQDAHMCMVTDGVVYDLANKSLLVRIKGEVFSEKDKLEGALTAYQVLGWLPFPNPEDNNEE